MDARPTAWRIWLSAARPRTLPAAVAPVLAGSALAYHDGHLEPGAATICLVFALLIQIGTNFANDYFDFIKGADTAERLGPRRAVASGWVAPSQMRFAIVLVLGAAFLVGLTLLRFGGWPLLVIGVSSIICAIAYTGGPCPLGYIGLGDLFVFIFFGLIAVGATYFVQVGSFSASAVIVGIGIGALTTNILVVNNYRDVETDAKAGKRTLVVRYGRGFSRIQFVVSLGVALTAPVALAYLGFGLWVLLPLLVAPMGWSHFRRLKEPASSKELIILLGDCGKLLAIYALLLSAGLGLTRV